MVQKWEYMQLVYLAPIKEPEEEKVGFFKAIHITTEGPTVVVDEQGLDYRAASTTFYKHLAQFGQEGWELISGTRGGDISYWLKRPIPDHELH